MDVSVKFADNTNCIIHIETGPQLTQIKIRKATNISVTAPTYGTSLNYM